MQSERLSVAALKALRPIAALSEQRLSELSELCLVERVSKTLDPFRVKGVDGQMVFLMRGELALLYPNGSSQVVVGGSAEAGHPLGRKLAFDSAKAITDIDLLRIDDDLIDIMATWDQIAKGSAVADAGAESTSIANWAVLTGLFSVKSLRSAPFAQLPAAHIGDLLTRFKRVQVSRGEFVIREGDEGDYYYLIESGKAIVERTVGGVSMRLAELKSGDAFGEEALLADARRNASVRMISDGCLLRLAKEDFNALLKTPLLRTLKAEAAQTKIAAGAQWIDVRYPSEYQYDSLPDALNIPLSEVRNATGVLTKDREYVLYCQTGRRSAAAAFLLAQRGLHAYVLEGGLRSLAAR